MTRSLEKSNLHFQRAVEHLPLGVVSNFRYGGEDRTIYVQKDKGGRIWDIDGNEYIDCRLGYGPSILGYADPRVGDAARAGMDVGGVFALATERVPRHRVAGARGAAGGVAAAAGALRRRIDPSPARL